MRTHNVSKRLDPPIFTALLTVWISAGAFLWLETAAATDIASNFEQIAKSALDDEGVDGSFVLYDEESDRFYRYNAERSRRPMAPASTFKILNSLIALEEGAIEDENEVIPWDGVDRSRTSWDQDQTLETAYQRSAYWAYQKIARVVGLVKMQIHVDAAGYGNGEIGDSVDTFWVDGPLEITPQQQVEFLRRLHFNDLPYSRRTIEIVKRIMIQEETDKYVLRAKTGWAVSTTPDIGWYVGYLTAADNAYYFALNVDIMPDGSGRRRTEVAYRILRRLGLMGDDL